MPKILSVENQDETRQMLRMALQKCAALILEASDGASALQVELHFNQRSVNNRVFRMTATITTGRQRLVPGNMLGRAQSSRLTPRVSSFFAYESLRFVAFAAVSAAAWTALGPFCAAVLINPIL